MNQTNDGMNTLTQWESGDEMDREKLIKDIERQMNEPTNEYVVLWFSEAEYVLELLKEQENEKKRNPVIVCPHCGKRVK